jgi:hypothetical protein
MEKWDAYDSNNKVELRPMTRELCHELYKSWENDDSIYMDMSIFKEYVYNEESVCGGV